ncbi:ABC transporter ATP-binding protein [Amycolatopsis samaneae]|uniref:ABC transporter ATP-binding protein n=1 Tax=Amycolatopsis samaneae TaxID=664691 RepID=A0ABW5GBL9_9PSEU
MNQPPVVLSGVSRRYGDGPTATLALDDVTTSCPAGSLTAVMGPSGSGKSTLLHVAAGLDRVDAGSVTLAGVDLSGLDETSLTRVRREHASFVFQAYNLMPALTVRQNVSLPLLLAGREIDRNQVSEVLDRVGLAALAGRRPAELSGGQQQRVAIARAVLTRPAVVFADEPTGALDTQTAAAVLELLRDQVRTLGQTVLMVTHDPVAATYADRLLYLVDGRVAAETGRADAATIASTIARLSSLSARTGSLR